MNSIPRFVLFSGLITLMAVASTHAGDVTIPNTFTSNTPALAAEVNENFAAVEAAVDDNAAVINTNTAAISSNTTAIGTNSAGVRANASANAANADAIDDHSESITTHQGRLAAAYGFVNARYLTEVNGTENISSVAWNAAENRYEITLEEKLWSGSRDCSLVATPYSDYPYFATASVGAAGPILYVFIHDSDGNKVQGSFSWVLFAY